MKIKVIIPVSTDKWNASVKADYAQCRQPDTDVEIVHLQHGPEAIQSEYDEAKAATHVLEEVSKTPPEHYDAIIIYCFSDPGLSGAREISTIPVLGIGESSQLFTMGLADRCGIITTLEQSVPRIRRKILARGFSKRFLSILPLGIPVLEYDQNEKVTRKALEVARYMVEQESIEAAIVEAADAISGARPGARRESLDQYLKRVRSLEEIASSHQGVTQSYALQAGREVRIFVKPEEVDDLAFINLARDIAKQIEESMQYPGQIKVMVIRETRAIDYAK